MRIFGWGKPRIEGQIGYFNLSEWWVNTFTEKERNYIVKKYRPMAGGTTGADRNSLTEGKILSTTQTVGMFLSGLSTWFSDSIEDRDIARRILKKATEIIDSKNDVMGLHFTFQALIEVWYRDRDTVSHALDEAVNACKRQIDIAPQAAKAFKKEYPKNHLPSHVGFEQLTIIYGKQSKYSDAIQVAKEAKKQGWAGDWDKRIERYEKKQNKQK